MLPLIEPAGSHRKRKSDDQTEQCQGRRAEITPKFSRIPSSSSLRLRYA
jgi:hypothetical protein